MDFVQLAQSLSPVWEFEGIPLPRQVIERCLAAAHAAPSSPGDPPWRFIILLNPERRAACAAALEAVSAQAGLPAASACRQAPALIAAAMVAPTDPSDGAAAGRMVAAALQNFLLCAWDEGAGALALAGDRWDSDAIRSACGLASGEQLCALVALGYPAAVPPRRPRVALADVSRWYE